MLGVDVDTLWGTAVKNDSPADVMPGTSASADAAVGRRPSSILERRADKAGHRQLRREGDKEGSPSFVPVPERIATFDNDGTLWCETPVPVQVYFALDRVKALESQHPEWKTTEPFASLLKGDLKATIAGGDEALLEIVMATHAGMTTVEFGRIVEDWIATAKHPETGRLFTEMTYQPMLELLAYLRANGFRNYIVTGGGIEFVRQWGERIYGVTPEQVIGSSIKTKFELRDGEPVLMRLPQLNFNNDKAGKPVTIHQHIGRAPTAAFGNSVGDQQMLEYTMGSGGARFGLLVLHDDAAREYAYGPAQGLPTPQLGAFTPALFEQAKKAGWTVVSMKDDWKQVFPFEPGAITAINILLEPDATMLQRAEANNARLLKVFPKGFALDASHRPHVTLLQRFVRTADLDKVFAAAGKVFAGVDVLGLRMEAFKYLLHPERQHWTCGHNRPAESCTARAAAGLDRCRGPVHRGRPDSRTPSPRRRMIPSSTRF